MKKIIFDLDNTLIMFNEKYIECYCQVLHEFGYDDSLLDAYKLYYSIGRYEALQQKYDKEALIAFVNNDIHTNYTLKFFDKLLDAIGTYWIQSISNEIKDTLNYLSEKYELYVLTNWFTNCQKKRLKKTYLLNYFKEVIGSDIVGPKPTKEVFDYLVKNKKDYIMIGDNIDIDYYGAINYGIDAILFDHQNQYSHLNIKKINKFHELKEVL